MAGRIVSALFMDGLENDKTLHCSQSYTRLQNRPNHKYYHHHELGCSPWCRCNP